MLFRSRSEELDARKRCENPFVRIRVFAEKGYALYMSADSSGLHGLLFARADFLSRSGRSLDFSADYVYGPGLWRLFGMVYRLFPASAHLAGQGPAGCHFPAPPVSPAGTGTSAGFAGRALVRTHGSDNGCSHDHHHDVGFCALFTGCLLFVPNLANKALWPKPDPGSCRKPCYGARHSLPYPQITYIGFTQARNAGSFSETQTVLSYFE